MPSSQAKTLPARLAALVRAPTEPNPCATPVVAELVEEPSATAVVRQQSFDSLVAHVNAVVETLAEVPPPSDQDLTSDDNPFLPIEPESFEAAGLKDSEVEALGLKYLLARGDLTGREIADQVRLPFVLVDEMLRRMKNDHLVVHRNSAPLNDYQYQLTDFGRERARRLSEHCSYFGSAPVSLKEYLECVEAQSLVKQHPSAEVLQAAFGDMVLSPQMMSRLGPAVNSGRGMFLYGSPGNGKTSIAQRVTKAFGQHIWIPRAIGVDGEIIRVFDPMSHEEIPLGPGTSVWDQRQVDKRWIRVRRPTIVAGGELTMESLEITYNRAGVCEAPLQLKSNCGVLVIDDFGRQRISINELLNRWIVPLEMRIDFLSLPNGKKVTVPFDQLIVFSTNLEPRQLVDEAFLRRVPYKIEVLDPTETEFRNLLATLAQQMGVLFSQDAVDYLIDMHYKRAKRPFRFCQPRDLLLQVRNYCTFHRVAPQLSREFFDLAVENYFAVM